MHLDTDIEEALSYIWEFKERRIEEPQEIKDRLKEKIEGDILSKLSEKRYISLDAGKVLLTEEGQHLARDIIRRQRLAERLLVDVFEIQKESLDSIACEFEHVISPEVEKSICTLLGHPKLCPHGSPIPAGNCCKNEEEILKSVITTLNKLRQGERAKIIYMLFQSHPALHKLLSLGVTPQATVKIHQTFPSFVIDVDGQEIALDAEIAKNIYVKKL